MYQKALPMKTPCKHDASTEKNKGGTPDLNPFGTKKGGVMRARRLPCKHPLTVRM